MSRPTEDDLCAWLVERARIRVYSTSYPEVLLADGFVVAYSFGPVVYVCEPNGSKDAWPVSLRMERVPDPAPSSPDPLDVFTSWPIQPGHVICGLPHRMYGRLLQLPIEPVQVDEEAAG